MSFLSQILDNSNTSPTPLTRVLDYERIWKIFDFSKQLKENKSIWIRIRA